MPIHLYLDPEDRSSREFFRARGYHPFPGSRGYIWPIGEADADDWASAAERGAIPGWEGEERKSGIIVASTPSEIEWWAARGVDVRPKEPSDDEDDDDDDSLMAWFTVPRRLLPAFAVYRAKRVAFCRMIAGDDDKTFLRLLDELGPDEDPDEIEVPDEEQEAADHEAWMRGVEWHLAKRGRKIDRATIEAVLQADDEYDGEPIPEDDAG